MKKKPDKFSPLILGAIFLLPCLIIDFLNYLMLYLKYMKGKNVIRVIDIKNLRTPIIFACAIFVFITIPCCVLLYNLIFEK